MNIYNYISDLHLSVGESRRLNCPVCNGYKTFSVTNNMGSLLWNCYKVSCVISGSYRIKISVEDIKNSISKSEDTKEDNFSMPEHIVPHDNKPSVSSWCDTWQINPDELNLFYDVKEDRVVFPIHNEGRIVNAIGRSLGKRLPKWKKYGNNGLPYFKGCGRTAVVVEDCVSAAVVGSTNIVGVAVLGTSLSEAHKKWLAQFSTTIIALDPDALTKTLQFARELRGHVPNVKVLRLVDDIKYRNTTDLDNLNVLTPKE
jgi:hypothetical protein